MKNPQHSKPRSLAVATPQRNSSRQFPDPDPEAAEQLDFYVTRPELFLAWSNVREIAKCETEYDISAKEEYVSTPSPFPIRAVRHDCGLWLLVGALIRRDNWSQLDTEWDADPLPLRPVLRSCYTAAKRAGDFSASLILLVLLLPILVLVAVLVRLDSPGPALFRQRRIGKDGKEFLLWKFRSMRVDVPKYQRSPASDADPRITRVGRLIRRMSIDELPQLLNVLKGEMSLVGPRPEMPFVVCGYTAFERRRLTIKPGITGLWQVSPARAFPIHENLHYDLHYIQHQNPILDGAILLCTIIAVIRGVGAV